MVFTCGPDLGEGSPYCTLTRGWQKGGGRGRKGVGVGMKGTDRKGLVWDEEEIVKGGGGEI